MAGVRLTKSQKEKRDRLNTAHARKVFAIRRGLDPSSYGLMEGIAEKLSSRITENNDGNLSMIPTISTTVVGFSRFRPRLIKKGPPTEEIVSGVESLKQPLKAELGKLGLYGWDRGRRKLAFELHSVSAPTSGADIWEEIGDCEEAYVEAGYPLQLDPNSTDGRIVPHLTVGFLFADSAVKYDPKNSGKLERLDDILKAEGRVASFKPWTPPMQRGESV